MNIWLIGASSGIGLALANTYAKAGHQVWISARNEQALQEACQKQDNLHSLPLDITNDESLKAASKVLINLEIPFDKIIINAGTCEYIDSYTIEREKIRRVMETNFFGAVNVVNFALPLLRNTKKTYHATPQLVFVSSSVTYQALPRAGAYGASKAALRYFAETLRADLIHEGIDVRVVSPGFVKTPLTDVNDFPMPFLMDTESAANRVVKGLESSSFDIQFPKRFTLILKFISILPDFIRLRLIAKASRHEPDKVESNV